MHKHEHFEGGENIHLLLELRVEALKFLFGGEEHVAQSIHLFFSGGMPTKELLEELLKFLLCFPFAHFSYFFFIFKYTLTILFLNFL